MLSNRKSVAHQKFLTKKIKYYNKNNKNNKKDNFSVVNMMISRLFPERYLPTRIQQSNAGFWGAKKGKENISNIIYISDYWH